jgi:hypothetical protein
MVDTMMFVFTTAVGPCPVAEAAEQVASTGKPLQVKVIAVVKLLEAMMPTLLVPERPGVLIDTSVGPDTPANPGWIVNVTGALVLLWLVLKLESPP